MLSPFMSPSLGTSDSGDVIDIEVTTFRMLSGVKPAAVNPEVTLQTRRPTYAELLLHNVARCWTASAQPFRQQCPRWLHRRELVVRQANFAKVVYVLSSRAEWYAHVGRQSLSTSLCSTPQPSP